MKQHPIQTYLKNILFPCLIWGAVTGVLTGGTVYAFIQLSAKILHFSKDVYAFVRANPVFGWVLFPALIALAALMTFCLTYCPEAKGGGIPSAVGILRGLFTFAWLRTLLVTLFSAFLTYLGGVPLGTEGPCVQCGTAIGCGVSKHNGKDHDAWSRYIMTGGACAGFAAATFAPIAGIFFALEEAHRRFAPMILMTAFSGVGAAMGTVHFLSWIFHTPMQFVPLPNFSVPGASHWFLAVGMGILCGLGAVLFAYCYQVVYRFLSRYDKKIPLFVRIALIFCAVGGIGLALPPFLGSGHDLMEDLFQDPFALSLGVFLGILALRTLFSLLANNTGITGGMFLPLLSIGTLLGALIARCYVFFGLDATYGAFYVLLGMLAFFGAVNRTPMTALVFALEQFRGAQGLFLLCVGVFTSYLITEIFRAPSFADVVLEHKKEAYHAGKQAQIKEFDLVIAPDSFVVGKQISDIFWPADCRVLDVHPAQGKERFFSDALNAGDRLTLRIVTYDLEETLKDLTALVG